MVYPNNNCGECPIWLAMPDNYYQSKKVIDTHCINCKLFQNQRFVRHIPTQCCYAIEEDGSVLVGNCTITPKIDGKIFWEYVDAYVPKTITPSDPYANHRK